MGSEELGGANCASRFEVLNAVTGMEKSARPAW
jgi:hypothetical protein